MASSVPLVFADGLIYESQKEISQCYKPALGLHFSNVFSDIVEVYDSMFSL